MIYINILCNVQCNVVYKIVSIPILLDTFRFSADEPRFNKTNFIQCISIFATNRDGCPVKDDPDQKQGGSPEYRLLQKIDSNTTSLKKILDIISVKEEVIIVHL